MISYIPGFQCATAHITCNAELILEVLGSRHVDMQLVEWDGVADFEGGGVSSPATVVGGVQQAVAE